MARRIGFAAAALALVVAGVAVAYKLELLSSVDVQTGELAPEDANEPAPRADSGPKPSWPMFRFDEHRTGVNPGTDARPPFRKRWKRPSLGMNEVPPAIDDGILVGVSYGNRRSIVYARRAKSGRLIWRTQFDRGKNFAGGPAIADGRAYVPAHDGLLRAFDIHTGKVEWRYRARANEGPPVVSEGVLYFGDGDNGVGEMYALDVRRKRVRWRFRAQDHISSGAALTRSTVYFGSYDGSVYALNRATGKLRWRASATDAFGRGVGFFSTPAIARGLVVIGGLDGNLYAFDARSGQQRWRYEGEQGEIYASPAVAGRTAFVGGYGGTFSAVDLRSGRRKWTVNPGPNIGSPTVIGRVVYMSTLRPERTYGYSTRTGRRVWSFPDGKYSPVVADGRDLWLVGKSDVYRLIDKRGPAKDESDGSRGGRRDKR